MLHQHFSLTGLAAMCSTRQPNRTLGMIDGAGSYGARGGREEQQPEAGHNDAPSPRGTTQGHMDSVRRRVGPGAAGAGSALKPASPAHDPGHLQAPWTATLPAHRGVATSGPSTQVLDSCRAELRESSRPAEHNEHRGRCSPGLLACSLAALLLDAPVSHAENLREPPPLSPLPPA